MGRVDCLVAVAQISVGDEIEEIVRAGAANDSTGIKAERPPDCVAQRRRGAVRIILEMLRDGRIGGLGLRTGSERRLVGRKLEYARDALRRAFAGHIGLDIEHAGSRLGAREALGSHAKILSPVAYYRAGVGRVVTAETVYRVEWLPTRVAARTEAPASISACVTPAIPPGGSDTSRAPPSK